jgi:hypothetical protein
VISVHRPAKHHPLGIAGAGDASTTDSNAELSAGASLSDFSHYIAQNASLLQGDTAGAGCTAESGAGSGPRQDRWPSSTLSGSMVHRSDSDVISLHERCEEICSGINGLGSSSGGSGP